MELLPPPAASPATIPPAALPAVPPAGELVVRGAALTEAASDDGPFSEPPAEVVGGLPDTPTSPGNPLARP